MFLKHGCDFLDLRICDFGFAKQLRAQNGLLMTPCYTTNFVAPEVLKMQGYHTACDVWSLGVLLYVMLSGKTPFDMQDNISPETILKKIEISKLAFVGPEWKNINPSAIDLIQNMLCVDPKMRITIRQIKEHPWILKHDSLSNEPLTELHKNLDGTHREKLKKIFRDNVGKFEENTISHKLEPVHVSKIAQRRLKCNLPMATISSPKSNLPPVI